MKNKKLVLFALLLVTLGYIVYDSISQPGVDDLAGDFRELAVYRNENNTGPIVRIYAVSVEGSPWDEMRKYGELMPYTKYGSTTVYFFDASKPAPEKLAASEPNFGAEFQANCLAVYSKDQNGEVTFRKSPFQ